MLQLVRVCILLLTLLNMKYEKDMKEAEKNFDEQTDFICSICYEPLDCKKEIKALSCLHEFHQG